MMAFKGYKQTEDHKRKRALSKRRGNYFNCLVCNSAFWRQPSAIKKGDCKFCSKQCYYEWQKNRPKSENWKKLRIENNLKKAKFLTKRRLNRFLRQTNKYKIFRKSVFKRDSWSCQECGNKGVYLEAHHIKPFATYPELRFEISNAITLCKPCHSKKPKGKEVYAI